MQRVKGEHIKLPGLKLMPWEAPVGLEENECEAILEALVGTAFLRRTHDWAYVVAH